METESLPVYEVVHSEYNPIPEEFTCRKIGDYFCITSKNIRGLYIATRDEQKSFAGIRSCLEMFLRMENKQEASGEFPNRKYERQASIAQIEKLLSQL